MKLEKFFKAIIDEDRASVVICDKEHNIIYMNPAAVKNYEKRGGQSLVSKSIFDCHNGRSVAAIKEVVNAFEQNPDLNRVFTFHNEKQNKDVYMVALRDGKRLIGFYEKHEYRTPETAKLYDFNR